MAPGTEWADYYDELAAAFGLTIDLVGPVFGNEALLAEIADSAELATLAGRTHPATCGRTATTCAAYRCATRRPSTPCH